MSAERPVGTTQLARTEAADQLTLVQEDIRNKSQLDNAFANASTPIDAVIHFAELKAGGESVNEPWRYSDINVNGSLCLPAAMDSHGCQASKKGVNPSGRRQGAPLAIWTYMLTVNTAPKGQAATRP